MAGEAMGCPGGRYLAGRAGDRVGVTVMVRVRVTVRVSVTVSVTVAVTVTGKEAPAGEEGSGDKDEVGYDEQGRGSGLMGRRRGAPGLVWGL